MDGSYVLPSRQRTPTLQSSPSRVERDLSPSPPPSTPGANLDNTTSAISQEQRIRDAAQRADRTELQKIAAEPGGFQSSELRSAVWPVLLGVASKTSTPVDSPALTSEPTSVDDATPAEPPRLPSKDDLPPHGDERQVRLDVDRSFVSYPSDLTPEKKEALRTNLEDIIVTILRRHSALQYFQGYHDIISVLQLTIEDHELALAAAERMSLHRIRDSMGTGLEPVLGYLRLLHRILLKADPDMGRIVEFAAALPYFSLSWVLTLMSHDLTSIAVIARLFDFLLAHNPAIISYLGVAIVLFKKDALAQLDEESAEDPAILHHTLSQLPNLVDTFHSTPTPAPPTSTLSPASSTEDLMSSRNGRDRSDSISSSSFLSESIVSLSETSSLADHDDFSLDVLDDSMLSDPDIHGLAFSSTFQHQTSSSTPSPPKRQQKPQAPPLSIDNLLAKTLELWERYPLLPAATADVDIETSTVTESINADEVMGPNSCVFTWPLSVDGLLDDDGANEIARKGEGIVLPEAVLEPIIKEEIEAEETTSERKKGGKKKRERRSRKVEIGTVLAVVGVAGVLLAVYGASEWGSTKNEWRGLGGFGRRWSST